MSDTRDRLLASCANGDLATGQVVVDVGEIILRLLLFDTYIIDSHRLKELPYLVEAFGADGMALLLKSRALRIHCQPLTIAQMGQYEDSRLAHGKPILPLGSYSFGWVDITYPQQLIHDGLQLLHHIGLPHKQVVKLKRDVVDALEPQLPHAGAKALQGMQMDLAENQHQARTGVAIALGRRLGLPDATSQFSFGIVQIADGDFAAESDIGERYGLSREDVHDVISRGLLAVGGLNVTLAKMEALDALSGFQNGEISLFDDKFSRLTRSRYLDPGIQEAQFQRVIEIKGFPDVGIMAQLGTVDIERLLRIRETRECAEFRSWLFSIQDNSDTEIAEHIREFGEKVAWFAHSGRGKSLRWLATSGVGLIPGAGMILGPLASGLDMFLVDKLLRINGPIAFINRLYPTIFIEPH